MTTENAPAPRKRTLLIVAIVAVVVAVAAIALSIYLVARGGGDATPTPTPTNDVQTPAPSGTGVDACLGGADLTAAALFTAQQDAAPTAEGAVSYAAAFARYTYQVPLPSDIADVASANTLGVDKWADWQTAVDNWTGPNPLSSTTTNGMYRVQSYTPDEAVVTVVLPMVVDGAITTRSFAPTITLGRTVAGTWSVSDIDNSAAEDQGRLTDSVEFVGGC